MTKTEEIIETVREQQERRREPYMIAICGNAETVTSGYFLKGYDMDDEAAWIVQAGAAMIRESRHNVDHEIKSFFSDWNGGKYFTAGTVINGHEYGYACGNVATLEVDPPQWLKDLIDQASEAMCWRTRELEIAESVRLAMDVVEAVSLGEEPSEFVIENITESHLDEQLLKEFHEAVEHWRKGQVTT